MSDLIRDSAPEATPAAEELAHEAHIDLADVEGTGKDGRVTKPDVAEELSEDVTAEQVHNEYQGRVSEAERAIYAAQANDADTRSDRAKALDIVDAHDVDLSDVSQV